MAELINIQVVYALPEKQQVLSLQVEPNTSVLSAIEQSGICQLFTEIDLQALRVGVFYQEIDAQTYQLKDGDRVEIYRPLICDPKKVRMSKANQVRGRKWRRLY